MEKIVKPIHFEDFGAVEFERLCYAYLLKIRQWKSLNWYGQLGKDEGVDIWGTYQIGEKSRNYCYQCANRQVLGIKKGKDDIDKIICRPEGIPEEFIIICGGKVSTHTHREIKQYGIDKGIIEIDIWTGPEFEERLRKDAPDLIKRFCDGEEFPELPEKPKPAIIEHSEISDALANMHSRLIHLKNVKHSETKIGLDKFDVVIPTLMDKIGLISIDKWDDFLKKVKERVSRARRNERDQYIESRFKVAHVAYEIKQELIESKQWNLQDLVVVGNWLDLQHWGISGLRDTDSNWNMLYDSIKPYLSDAKLSELIMKHIDLSYAFCSVDLINLYSLEWPNNLFLALLHQTLVGSPVSKQNLDVVLGQVIAYIDTRVMEIQEKRRG